MLNIKIKRVKSLVCFIVVIAYLFPNFVCANVIYPNYGVNYAYNVPQPNIVQPVAMPAPMYNYGVAAPQYIAAPSLEPEYDYLPRPIESWAGPYLGVLFDMNENNAQIQHNDYFRDMRNADMGLGVLGGANFQSDSLVYGFVGKLSYPVNRHVDEQVDIKSNLKANLSTRLGVAIGHWMPYAFFGLGSDWTTIKDKLRDGSNFKNFHIDYLYGAGADFKLSNGLFAELEACVNQTSRQTANLDVSSIHFTNHSYGLHLAIAEKI